MEDVLIHYGILGMKWGVRRTPEELGHIRAAKGAKKLKTYKSKESAKVEKQYSKIERKISKKIGYDPENDEKLKLQIKSAQDLRDKSLSQIESMSYSDMEAAKKAARDAGIETAKDVGLVVLKAAPVAAMVAGAIAGRKAMLNIGTKVDSRTGLEPTTNTETAYQISNRRRMSTLNTGRQITPGSIKLESPYRSIKTDRERPWFEFPNVDMHATRNYINTGETFVASIPNSYSLSPSILSGMMSQSASMSDFLDLLDTL